MGPLKVQMSLATLFHATRIRNVPDGGCSISKGVKQPHSNPRWTILMSDFCALNHWAFEVVLHLLVHRTYLILMNQPWHGKVNFHKVKWKASWNRYILNIFSINSLNIMNFLILIKNIDSISSLIYWLNIIIQL